MPRPFFKCQEAPPQSGGGEFLLIHFMFQTSRNARSKDRYLGATASPPSKPTKQKKSKMTLNSQPSAARCPHPRQVRLPCDDHWTLTGPANPSGGPYGASRRRCFTSQRQIFTGMLKYTFLTHSKYSAKVQRSVKFHSNGPNRLSGLL